MTTDTETPTFDALESDAARLTAEVETRRRTDELNAGRLAEMTGQASPATPQGKVEISPITAAMMRGERVTVKIGTLSLSLKPLTRKKMRQFQELIFAWPNVIQFAATVKNPKHAGIDYEATAALMTVYLMMQFDDNEEKRAQKAAKDGIAFVAETKPAPITENDVAGEVAALVNGEIDAYDADINAAVWLMVEGMPGVVWPKTYHEAPILGAKPDEPQTEMVEDILPVGVNYLSDLLEEHLTIPQYADLLRVIKAGNGGYEGDITDTTF